MTTKRIGRPTVYKGIRMRSRLEADFARHLDKHPDVHWDYEPCCFADSSGHYLPDFRTTARADGSATYVEIKPATIGLGEIESALARMEIIWASEPDAFLTLFLWEHSGYETGAAGFIDGYPGGRSASDFVWWCHPNTLTRLQAPGIIKGLCGAMWPESNLAMWPGRGQLAETILEMEKLQGGDAG